VTVDGLLVVDKPAGPTSHDVVDEVRRLARIRRVGHTGTLDPFATGVLPLCLGRATRLSRFLTSSRKVYEATMCLGISTDTYDATGRVVRHAGVQEAEPARVREAARRFTGEIPQVPPPFSARKLAGRRLHERARAGEMVLLPPSPVTIHRLEIVEVSGQIVRFVAETSAGTYIRSLAHDLGEALGCGAHLTALRRTASGSITLEQAHTLEEIRNALPDKDIADLVTPMEAIDLGLPTVVVTLEGTAAMASGRPLTSDLLATVPSGWTAHAGHIRVADVAGRLLGVALPGVDPVHGACLRPDVVLMG
jgi:tRNA pseudouridine55 synthase